MFCNLSLLIYYTFIIKLINTKMIKKFLLLSAFVSTSLHAQNTIVFEENFDNEEAFSK